MIQHSNTGTLECDISSNPEPLSEKYCVDPVSRIRQSSFCTSATPLVHHLEVEDLHVLTTEDKSRVFAKHLPSQLAQVKSKGNYPEKVGGPSPLRRMALLRQA